jgi:WD40 repeat protein
MDGFKSLYHLSDKFGHTAPIYGLYGQDHMIWAGDGNGQIVSWDINSPDGTVVAQASCPIYCLIVDIQSPLLIAGDMHGYLHWIDLQEKKIIKRHSAHPKGVFSLVIDDEFLYSAGGDGCITKWSLSRMQPLETLQLSPVGIRSLYIDNSMIYLGDGRGHLISVIMDTFLLHDDSPIHDSTIFSIERYLGATITGSRDATIKLVKDPARQPISINAHWYTVNKLICVDNTLISASRDKRIRLWSLPFLECIDSIDYTRNGHTKSVNNLYYLSDHSIIASVGDDRVIKLWLLR